MEVQVRKSFVVMSGSVMTRVWFERVEGPVGLG